MGILPPINSAKITNSRKQTWCFLMIVVYALAIHFFAEEPLRWFYYVIPASLFIAGIRFSYTSSTKDEENQKI